MTLQVQVARGLKWQVISIVGRQFLSFAVFTTLARLLDPASFGLVGLVGIYLGFIALLAEQGIGSSLIQRQSLEAEHLDTAFWFNVLCSLVLCFGTIILAGPISTFLGEPKLVALLRWSSFGLVISSLSAIHSTLFVKELDFRRPVIRTLIANAVGGAVGIGMALTHFGVWALVGQQLAGGCVGTLFLWAVSPYRPAMRFSLKHLRELMNVSSSVLVSSLIHAISSKFDQIFIGRFSGTHALGFYVIAGKLPELSKFLISTPLTEVSLPALSRLQEDHGQMRQAICRGIELNAMLCFAIFLGIAAIASDLVPFLFGDQWAAAGTLCSLLSIYLMFSTLAVFIHPILVASGGAGRYVILNIIQAIGTLAACIIGIRFGINYLVVGQILNAILLMFLGLVFLRKRIGLEPLDFLRPCFIPAFASAVMIGCVWLFGFILKDHLILPLLLAGKIIVGATVYIGFILFFKRTVLLSFIDSIRHAFGNSLNSDAP